LAGTENKRLLDKAKAGIIETPKHAVFRVPMRINDVNGVGGE
jgi:hypothetical protein